jgi:hypothetical protein
MSNVKVNGNTYNGVTSVKLALADGTGFETYSKGMVTSDITNDILSGNFSGDYENSEITRLNACVLANNNFGTISFPNAVTMFGIPTMPFNGENLLLPKVAKIEYGPCNKFCGFQGTITGTLDLSGIESTGSTLNQTFMGAKIGTLKIGKMQNANMLLANATITNLVWNIQTLNDQHTTILNGATAITNAYIADAHYEAIKALVENGTITKITNLYKFSEWSGE